MKKIMEETFSGEFPTINLDYCGYENKYTYVSEMHSYDEWKDKPYDEKTRDNLLFQAVVKIDLRTEEIVSKIMFGENKSGVEVYFQKKENS